MDRSVHRMDQMIEDLVDSSSLESGVLSIRRQWHDLSAIVAEALEAQTFTASGKSLSLISKVPREALRIFCDRARLQQVLANLLGNAIKFTPSKGSIELSVHRAESEILFSVTDTGRGIPRKDLPRVFDRHWQSRSGKSGRSGGSGLGLYISKGIVEAHGGKIWVESELNKWSAFSFTIPNGRTRRVFFESLR
jgi:signal transduction histidine kinase